MRAKPVSGAMLRSAYRRMLPAAEAWKEAAGAGLDERESKRPIPAAYLADAEPAFVDLVVDALASRPDELAAALGVDKAALLTAADKRRAEGESDSEIVARILGSATNARDLERKRDAAPATLARHWESIAPHVIWHAHDQAEICVDSMPAGIKGAVRFPSIAVAGSDTPVGVDVGKLAKILRACEGLERRIFVGPSGCVVSWPTGWLRLVPAPWFEGDVFDPAINLETMEVAA